jgi:transcriptional regulator with XRE-family HTH domain
MGVVPAPSGTVEVHGGGSGHTSSAGVDRPGTALPADQMGGSAPEASVGSEEPAPAAGEPPEPSAADLEGLDRSAIDELGSYIRAQRESARLSLRKLAKIAGVSNPYLSQIERGLRKPSAEILQAIAKALEISSETLYVKAGILEEREHELDVEEAVAQDPHLTDAQRQALLEMYRSFRRLSELQPTARSKRRVLLDAVTTGGVDDAAVRAASAREEDGSV